MSGPTIVGDSQTNIVISAIDKTQEAFNSISANVGKLQGAMGALGATLSVGAFVAWQKSLIDAADNMQDLSQKVGIGVRELAGYKLAAEQSGTSLEAVAKGVKKLSTYMVEHGDKLKAAGITAKDADGALQQLSEVFANMPDGVQKTALATQLFGKAGMDMIPMLNLGAKGLAEATEKSSAYAKQLAELAPKADKFNDSMAQLKLNAQGFGMSIASPIVDGLNKIADALGKEFGGKEGSIGYWLRTQGGSNIKTGQQIWDAQRAGTAASVKPAANAAAILLDKSSASTAKAGVDELAKATEAWLKSVDAAADGIDKQIAAAQKELDTFGMSREALAAYTAQQTEKLALDKEHEAQTLRLAAAHAGPLHGAYMQAANDLDEQARKLRQVADLQKQLAGKETIAANLEQVNQHLADALKENGEAWKKWEAERQKSADQIGEALAQSLMAGGKNAGEYLKRYFATLVLQPVIQGLMAPIANTISGALYGNGPGGGLLGGGGGLGGAISSGSSLLGGSSLISGIANSSLLSGSELGLGLDYAGSFGIGQGLLDSFSIGGMAGLGAALPGIGAILGIGSALGLFGGNKEDPHNNPDARYIVGRLGKSGLSAAGGNLAHITMGQTSGSGRWADYSALAQEEIAQIEKMGAAVFASGRKLADILGVDAKVLDDVSVEGERFKDAGDMVGKLGDAIALNLIPNLADFQQASESLSQAAQRVVADITALDTIAKASGRSFGGNVADRAGYAEKIVGAAGGSGALNSYYSNYFSAEERRSLMAKSLGEQFSALGLDMPGTRQEFRDLVTSLMDGGDATASLAGKVLALGDAFASVADAAEAATEAAMQNAQFTRAGLTVGFTTLSDGMLGLPDLTAHANGGLASGWSLVGERGPELVNFSSPGRVYTASETRQALGGSTDPALLRTMQAIERRLVEQSRYLKATADATNGRGGAPMLTTAG